MKLKVNKYSYDINKPIELKVNQKVIVKGSKKVHTIIGIHAPEVHLEDRNGLTYSVYAGEISGVLA